MSWLSSKEGLGGTYVTSQGRRRQTCYPDSAVLVTARARKVAHPMHPNPALLMSKASLTCKLPTLIRTLGTFVHLCLRQHWRWLARPWLIYCCSVKPSPEISGSKEGHCGAHSIQTSGWCKTSAKSSVNTCHRWENGNTTTSGPSPALASIKFTWNVF